MTPRAALIMQELLLCESVPAEILPEDAELDMDGLTEVRAERRYLTEEGRAKALELV